MTDKKYPNDSWMDARLTTRTSDVAGHGVFATAPIRKGEVIVRWGGIVYTTQQVLDGKTNDQTACQIDEDSYIASPPETILADSDLMNHSCDPNTWMDDEVTISARRDIEPGEEVTADYALWVADPGYVTITNCHCGSSLCRKIITGDDWKLQEVQERYAGHVPPYLEKRIKKMVEIQPRRPPRILTDVGLSMFMNTITLRELSLPVVEIPIEQLIWHFDMPVWDKDGTDGWNLTPWEVIRKQEGSVTHQKRVEEADAIYPIIVTEYKSRLVILDGVHRLAKAYENRQKTIKTKIIPTTYLSMREFQSYIP